MNTHTLNALAYELELVLSDPDSKLSDEAERAISYTVAALRAQPAAGAEYSQFLSDVMTAAGLVSHGKQSKALGERLGAAAMKYMIAAPVAAQAPAALAAAKGESNG